MNGTGANGDSPTAVNGSQPDPQILQALEVVHNPRSSNELRQQATQFLETLKQRDEAPYHGFLLASETSQVPVVRYFGLSLIEAVIKYRWHDYTIEQTTAVRDWVLQLVRGITAADASFLRNKIAQLWVEVAKRSWMLDWRNMDELLASIWQGGPIEKFFVMEVLENLIDNSFGKEDAVGAIRGDDLSNYCLDILTPKTVFREHFPNRDDLGCRHGEEGWLLRVVDFLSWCVGQDPKDQTVTACAVKAATMLKSCLEWVPVKAIVTTGTPDRLCQALMSSNDKLVLEALQCLFLLLSRRPKFSHDDVVDIVHPFFTVETIEILRKVYNWSSVDVKDIDEDRYLICKKLTPLLFQLGCFVEEHPAWFFGHIPMDPFFNFLLETVQSQSLHVSIPILHLWATIMASREIRASSEVLSRVRQLLDVCSQRLVRYEELPTDSDLPALVFLEEDVETPPERHQFLGNYARFAKETVDGMVQQQPGEALEYILHQTDDLLAHLYDHEPAFDPQACTRYPSPPAIRLDAQAAVIEAAVFGYAKWRSEQRAIYASRLDEVAERQAKIDGLLESWVMTSLQKNFEDPAVQQRLVSIFISCAVGPLRKSARVVTETFQYIMRTKLELYQRNAPPLELTTFDAQCDELQKFCSHQLQRLAIKSHDFLATQYDSIESEAEGLIAQMSFVNSDRERVLSVPFIILQRATSLPDEQRRTKLTAFVQSRLGAWSDTKLSNGLQDFDAFCQLIGLGGFQDQFLSRGAAHISDWSTQHLSQDGESFKADVEYGKSSIPIGITRTILGASVDRADGASLDIAKQMWAPHVPIIVPHIVTLIKLSIQFSAPSTWYKSPAEVQDLVRRIMKDRFWQVGISTGTREEFYNRVTSTKKSLEGLASTIRGSIREVRETSFKILALMTYLDDVLYSLGGLSTALCEAMFSHPMALSTHQTVVLLESSRALIEQCPEQHASTFLPEFMINLFEYLDTKISREWALIEQKKEAASEDDDLTEEMKEESILRNLTFTAVMFVSRLFDPDPSRNIPKRVEPGQEPIVGPRRFDLFIIENPSIFKSLITFCTHVLRMHDSRSCSYIIRVLRQLIPYFANIELAAIGGEKCVPQLDPQTYSDIREFISDEVLKGCITSLHDPYFVDIQPDLASLIAKIITNYAQLSQTPRNIILSLPEMTEQKVDTAFASLAAPRDSKRQRNTILKLLAGLRGVSVAEQGKILQQGQRERRKQDPTLSKYAEDRVATKGVNAHTEDDGALQSIAGMFGGA